MYQKYQSNLQSGIDRVVWKQHFVGLGNFKMDGDDVNHAHLDYQNELNL